MSDGAEICRTLRGVNLGGGAWLVKCPLETSHEKARGRTGPSCTVHDLPSGAVAAACSFGCPSHAILEGFARRGLIDPPSRKRVEINHEPDPEALRIWNHAGPIKNTLAAAYLREYGCTKRLPASLRFRPSRPPILPMLVCAVQAPNREIIAVQLILLEPGRPQLAAVDKPRIIIGALGAGAVRFAPASEDVQIAVNVEDAAVASERGEPTWACLLPARRHRVIVPVASEAFSA